MPQKLLKTPKFKIMIFKGILVILRTHCKMSNTLTSLLHSQQKLLLLNFTVALKLIYEPW